MSEDSANRQRFPLVSIIMNCFNGQRYLRQAIESVLAQSYSNWEIIFWDNQSTDNSASIFKSYTDSRFRYFYADKHTVLYDARNYALSKCKGELVAFLDVDDWWFPEKLNIQVPLFNGSTIGVSCGNYILVNQRKDGNVQLNPRYVSLPYGNVLDALFDDYFVHMSTLVVRRKAFEILEKKFDARFNIIGDLEMMVRLCSSWELASVQLPIAYYRWHQNNTGYKTELMISNEFNTWINEIKTNSTYTALGSFLKFERRVNFYIVLKLLYDGNRLAAYRKIGVLPFKQKIKLLMALLLPNYIVKLWINRK